VDGAVGKTSACRSGGPGSISVENVALFGNPAFESTAIALYITILKNAVAKAKVFSYLEA
jgi:hypothetical protein